MRKREHVEGDLYDIGNRIKDIDRKLVLTLDRKKGQYEIYRDKRHVMYIKPGELDARILVQLRKNDLTRRRLMDFILELERSEEKAEKLKAKRLRSRINDITLENFNRLLDIPQFACGSWK